MTQITKRESDHQDKPILIVNARPNDVNPHGDVFGGWLLSHLDVAGAICATQRAKGSVVTVAIDKMQFVKPLFVQDLVKIYATVICTGKTSITVALEAYADRDYGLGEVSVLIADATFIYVAIAKPGEKKALST